jgi:hypothetical protein
VAAEGLLVKAGLYVEVHLGESLFRKLLSESIFQTRIPVLDDENPVPRSPKLTLKKCRLGRGSWFPF